MKDDADTLLEAMPPEALARLVAKVEQGRAADRMAPTHVPEDPPPPVIAAPRKSHRKKRSAFRPLRKQPPDEPEQDARRQGLGDWGSGCHRVRPLYEVDDQ